MNAAPAAAQEGFGNLPDQPAPISPLDEALAAKAAAIEAAAEAAPEPAPIPLPPEPTTGNEALIELPIAPSNAPQEESDQIPAPAVGEPSSDDGTVAPAKELQRLRVVFAAGAIEIDEAAQVELFRLAGYLNQNQAQRVVLRAHASASEKGSSQARRLSLSRAIAIRRFLVDGGVPAERIFLRPLGSEFENGPPDRVDILPLRP